MSVNPVAGIKDLIAERDALRAELAEHRAAAVVIKPGDHVLVVLKDRKLTRDQAYEIKRELQASFPRAAFTIVPDCFAVVLPGEPNPVDVHDLDGTTLRIEQP